MANNRMNRIGNQQGCLTVMQALSARLALRAASHYRAGKTKGAFPSFRRRST